jgi:hypothetical protein
MTSPQSGPQRDGELHRVAERLFRATGNRQGRSRLEGNGRVTSGKPPRALVVATGEEVPSGRSIRARLLVVGVGPEEVDRLRLTECQQAACQGRLAESMGSFLGWMAGRYGELQQRRQARMVEIRSYGYGRAVHARLPAALAELQSAWELFVGFALEVCAINSTEGQELEARSIRALCQLATIQAIYQDTSDPALRFVALLRAALTCGRAHVADRNGRAPQEAAQWGWLRRRTGWMPQGVRIGWVSGIDLFLEPRVSYQAAQDLAGDHRLPGEQSLRHRLRQCGLLAGVDEGRQMVQVRRTLEGSPKQVLHLKASDLVELRAKSRSCQSSAQLIR